MSVAAQEAPDAAAAPDDFGFGEEAVSTVAEPAATVDEPPPVEAPALATEPVAQPAPAAATPQAPEPVREAAPVSDAESVREPAETTQSAAEEPAGLVPTTQSAAEEPAGLVPTTQSAAEEPVGLVPTTLSAVEEHAGLAPSTLLAAAGSGEPASALAVPMGDGADAPFPNLNVDIRILSPGDDGDVVQGGGVLLGGAPIASPQMGGDWIWNWTWNWDTDCAPGDLPTPMTVGASGWSWDWTWDWSCGAAPAQPVAPGALATAPLPAIATPPTVAPHESVAPAAAPVAAADGQRPPRQPPLAERQPSTSDHLAAPVPARVRMAVLAPALSTVASTRGTAHASAGALPGPDPAGEPPAPDPPAPAPSAAGAGAAGAAGTGSILLAALLAGLTLLAPGRGRRMRGHARTPRQPLDSRRPERPG